MYFVICTDWERLYLNLLQMFVELNACFWGGAVYHQMFLLPGCVCNRVVASITEAEREGGRGSICKQHILSNWQSIHRKNPGCVVAAVLLYI